MKTKIFFIAVGPVFCAATLLAQNVTPLATNAPAPEPGAEIVQVFERQQMLEARSQAFTNTLPVAVEDVRSLSASALGQLLQKLPQSLRALPAASPRLNQSTNVSELPEVFERLQMMEARHAAFTNTLPVSLENVRESTGSALEELLQRIETVPAAAPTMAPTPSSSPASTGGEQAVQNGVEQLRTQVGLLSQRMDRLESSMPPTRKNKK
jgi:uncharacterized protein YceH (UPF0502 family)